MGVFLVSRNHNGNLKLKVWSMCISVYVSRSEEFVSQFISTCEVRERSLFWVINNLLLLLLLVT